MIVGVAIRSENIVIMLPKPNRHCNCFWHANEIGLNAVKLKIGTAGKNQGFYTDKGVYLDRQQALRHAKRCEQEFTNSPDGPPKHGLFSEDVW